LVENLVIVHSPATDQKIGAIGGRRSVFEQTTNAILSSIPRESGAFATLSFHDSSFAAIFPFQLPLVLLETRPWGLPDEPAFESLLLDRIVGFDPGVRRVRE
jgi:hypothetical protein